MSSDVVNGSGTGIVTPDSAEVFPKLSRAAVCDITISSVSNTLPNMPAAGKIARPRMRWS